MEGSETYAFSWKKYFCGSFSELHLDLISEQSLDLSIVQFSTPFHAILNHLSDWESLNVF